MTEKHRHRYLDTLYNLGTNYKHLFDHTNTAWFCSPDWHDNAGTVKCILFGKMLTCPACLSTRPWTAGGSLATSGATSHTDSDHLLVLTTLRSVPVLYEIYVFKIFLFLGKIGLESVVPTKLFFYSQEKHLMLMNSLHYKKTRGNGHYSGVQVSKLFLFVFLVNEKRGCDKIRHIENVGITVK